MKKGFTLIEMLAVIAILAIIIGLAFQAMDMIVSKSREKTNIMSVKNYANTIEATVFSYMEKNNTLNISVSKEWIINNLNISNESIDCASIYYKHEYGVVLGNCTITSASNTFYFYDDIVLKNTDSLTGYNAYVTSLLSN